MTASPKSCHSDDNPATRGHASLTEMLRASIWARSLTVEQLRRVESAIVQKTCRAGSFICSKGEPVEHWIGIIDGLAKMTNLSAAGKPTTFTGVSSGAWFGEGSLLKDEPRRYDIVALFNPYLYPGLGLQLQISQEEIGYLAGLSRQRANQSLKALEKAGLLRVDYCGITVLDLAGLRSFTS